MKRAFQITILASIVGAFIYALAFAGDMHIFRAGGTSESSIRGKGIGYIKLPGGKTLIFLPDGSVDADIVVTGDAPDQGYVDGQVVDTPEEGITSGQFTIQSSGSGADVRLTKGRWAVTSSAGWGNVGGYSQAIVRQTGRTFFSKVISTSASNIVAVGWKEDGNSNFSAGGGDRWSYDIGSASQQINEAAAVDLEEIGTAVNATEYQVAFALGGYSVGGVPYFTGETASSYKYGCSYWIRGGIYTNWTLLWKDAQQNTTPMYAAFGTPAAIFTIDDLLVPGLVSDVDTMFTPAYIDTTPDTNAHDIGTGNAIIDTNVTMPAGVADFYIRFRYQDASNFWNVKILSGTAGTDLTLHKTTATVEGAAVASADMDFAAAAHDIRIIADGSTFFRVFVNRQLQLSYDGPDTAFQAETEIQLVDGGSAFTENRLVAWPRMDADWNVEFADKTGGVYREDYY